MLYPELKQRTVLGWRIQWVAGLFCLLMVAAGSVPAYVPEVTGLDREQTCESDAFAETAADERLSLSDSFPSSLECLQSGATGQAEVETEETEVSASLSGFQLSCFSDIHCSAQHDERFLPSTDAARSRFSRAPPLA